MDYSDYVNSGGLLLQLKKGEEADFPSLPLCIGITKWCMCVEGRNEKEE